MPKITPTLLGLMPTHQGYTELKSGDVITAIHLKGKLNGKKAMATFVADDLSFRALGSVPYTDLEIVGEKTDHSTVQLYKDTETN